MSNIEKAKQKTQTTGHNSVAITLAEKVLVENIKTSDVFKSLIPIKENDLQSITKNMRQNGFEVLHPVCIWKEKNTLIDGHVRLRAAIDVGLNEIYCYKKSFENEYAAIEFAINEQLRRRNLDDTGKLLLIEKLDNLKKAGRPTSEITELSDKGKSSAALAKTLGVSSRTIERGRAVLKTADDETLNKIKSGEISISKAYENLKRVRTINKKVTGAISDKETTEYPYFSLLEIVDVLYRRKYYTLAFLLFEDLKVDIELQKHFVKTMPEDIQKSFALDERMKA